MDDTRSTLLQLLGIEQWVPRSVVSPVPRRASAPAVHVRREVAPATVPVALIAPASRSIAPRPDPRVARAPADRATVRASPVQGPRLALQADLHACGTVLAVLEQSVTLPQRFVRDICTALGGRQEALLALEDFAWPPPGRDDLAEAGACRSALLAVLSRLWRDRGLRAVVLFGPTLAELGNAGLAPLTSAQQSGMWLLHVADPATLLADTGMKVALWGHIQRGAGP